MACLPRSPDSVNSLDSPPLDWIERASRRSAFKVCGSLLSRGSVLARSASQTVVLPREGRLPPLEGSLGSMEQIRFSVQIIDNPARPA